MPAQRPVKVTTASAGRDSAYAECTGWRFPSASAGKGSMRVTLDLICDCGAKWGGVVDAVAARKIEAEFLRNHSLPGCRPCNNVRIRAVKRRPANAPRGPLRGYRREGHAGRVPGGDNS